MKARSFALASSAAVALLVIVWPLAVGQATPVKLTDPSVEPAFCRIDLGDTGSVTGDTFYLSLDGDDDLVEVNDIRLTAFSSKGPGTLVQAGDTSETVAADCQALTVAYYDGFPNSRYGPGDYVLVGYDKSTTQRVEGSTHTGDYWVRLTSYSSTLGAGTIVMSGSQDFAAYGAGTAITGAEHAFWDKDASSGFNAGDVAYLAALAVSTNDHVPVASVRLVNATYHFGTLAAIGDSDVSLMLTDPSTDVAICRIDHGTPGALFDDGFYLSMDGDDDAVEAQDLRLVGYGGKEAGTVVLSSDTAEVAAATCQTHAAAYYDMDNSGAYNVGDSVMIGYDKTTSTLVQPSSGDGDWWIRVTPSGSLAAGTLVNGGDADYSSKTAGSTLTGAEFAYFNADGSSAFSVNDWAYLTSAAISDRERPPTGSVRLHGALMSDPAYAFGTVVKDGDKDGLYKAAATTTTTTTSATTTTSNSTTSAATTSSTTSSSAAEDTTASKTGTPGPGAIALLVAVGAAVLALAARRR